MHNKLLHKFSSNNKCCCEVHIQATWLLKRNKHWNAFSVWLYKKQLGSLRGISHSPRCCWYVKSLLLLFCVYMIKGDDALTVISPFEAKSVNKNRYEHFRQPAETKIMQMCMYQFKLTKNLFLSRGYEHVSSLARWNRLFIDTKILLSQTAYHINTQLLCHYKNFLYSSCTFSVLS